MSLYSTGGIWGIHQYLEQTADITYKDSKLDNQYLFDCNL